MRIFFDQGVPVPLRRFLAGHSVDTCAEKGWSRLQNGELLREVEAMGYNVFITTDQNLRYQQSVTGRKIAIVVLRTTSWPRIQLRVSDIAAVVDAAVAGDYVEVPF